MRSWRFSSALGTAPLVGAVLFVGLDPCYLHRVANGRELHPLTSHDMNDEKLSDF